MKQINFNSLVDMITWLIENEGMVLADGYGREWMYKNFDFYFKDIGSKDSMDKGIKCLHLYKTDLFYGTI